MDFWLGLDFGFCLGSAAGESSSTASDSEADGNEQALHTWAMFNQHEHPEGGLIVWDEKNVAPQSLNAGPV